MKKRLLTLLLISAAFAAGIANESRALRIKYDEPPKGLVYIRSVQSPFGVWDQPGYPVDYVRGSAISTYSYEGKRDQLYLFEKDGDGWWHIIPQTGGAVTLEGNKNGNGVRLVIWDHDRGAANQKFLVQHQGNGRFMIFSSYGRAITLANRSAPTTLQFKPDNHDGAWMEWHFIDYLTQKMYIPGETAVSPDRLEKSGTLKEAPQQRYCKNILKTSAGVF